MRSSPQNPGLCDYLETSRIPYVMAVPKTTQFTDTTGKTVHLNALAGQLRRNAWQRRACGIGSKGPRTYDWALLDSADPDHQSGRSAKSFWLVTRCFEGWGAGLARVSGIVRS